MNRNLLTLISAAVSIGVASVAAGARIPAGTTLMVRTVQPISTHERVGALFKGELEHDVTAQGKVVLRAGTPVTGVIETSLRHPPRSGSVTVNLRTVSANGRTIPVHTTGSYKLPPRFTTRSGISVSGRETNYPHRTRMTFRLAQPLEV